MFADCKVVARYLDRLRDDGKAPKPDVTFANIRIVPARRFMRFVEHPERADEPFAVGWTIAKRREPKDPAFTGGVRIVDGVTTVPDSVQETRWILSDHGEIVRLSSGVVLKQIPDPFGQAELAVAVLNSRAGHEDEDAKRLATYVNDHRDGFARTSIVAEHAYASGLFYESAGKVPNAYAEDVSIVLDGLRQMHGRLDSYA